VHGAALSFGSSNDVVHLGVADISPPWTAALWVKRADSPLSSSAIFLTPFASALKLEQYPNLKTVGVTPHAGNDPSYNYPAPIGQWVHLTFVGTSTSTALYVNG